MVKKNTEMRVNMKWNRKYTAVLSGAVVIAVTVCGIGYRVAAASTETTEETENEQGKEESLKNFTEEGTTQIKTESQLPEFAVGAVTMTVEEVYAEAGDNVEEGTALFKLTDESMQDAIAYYEEAVEDAKDTLETAQLDFSSGTLEAEYELSDTQLAADTAQSTYEAKLAELTVSVDEKKEAYNDAIEEIQEYQGAIDNGTYYSQVGITEKQAAVEAAQTSVADAKTQLEAAQTAYEAAQTAIAQDMSSLKEQISANASYDVLQQLAEQVATDYANVQTATTDLSQKQTAADTAQGTLEKANLTLENATKEYNSLVESANKKIEELTSKLEDLREAYEQAERDATTAQAGIQKEYEEAVLAGQYAGTEYETTLKNLAESVESAQETLDELLEEQQALLAIEDGVICADRAGTLAAIGYEEGDVLMAGAALASYYDAETIYISVEVAQEQIALLTVGDEASVSVTGSRNRITGKISSIATEKTSGGSISNVTYAVVIEIDNTDGALSSGSSATVMFDYEEDIEEGVE